MTAAPRIILITGAAGNLGQAVAAAFDREGARLLLADRPGAALDKLARSVSDGSPVPLDLLDAEQTRTAVASALGRSGRIDVLCHLAGGFRMGEAVHETTAASWDFLFDLNARSLVHIGRAVVPRMIEQGSGKIVTVGAYAAQAGVAQMGAYVAARSSVIRLTEAMSAELKEKGINVNCVLPTVIDTPDNRTAMPDADPARWVPLDALAAVIVFLASDDARAIHGAAIPVRGLS